MLKVLGSIAYAVFARWLRSSRRSGATRTQGEGGMVPRGGAGSARVGARSASRAAPSKAPAAASGAAPAKAKKIKGGGVPGPEAVLALVRSRAEGEWVVARLRVLKVLSDDQDGSRHQRLLVKVGQDGRGNDFTVKVSHNIDLAPRVPIGEGEDFTVRGEFVWNDLGGAIHWTHHDPEGRHEGGWIEFESRRYA